jgi:hypothetical protein
MPASSAFEPGFYCSFLKRFHYPFCQKGSPDTLVEQRRGMIISDVLLEFSLFTFLAVLKADLPRLYCQNAQLCFFDWNHTSHNGDTSHIILVHLISDA